MSYLHRMMMTGLGCMCSAAIAFPSCPSPSKTVFSCTTTKGKVIEVCDSGKTIDYAFGKPADKPEIVVNAPRKMASTTQWQGMGRTIYYAVDVPNGKTTYSVFWSYERPIDDSQPEPVPMGGVTVRVGVKALATVDCDLKKPINQSIEGIDLRPTDEE